MSGRGGGGRKKLGSSSANETPARFVSKSLQKLAGTNSKRGGRGGRGVTQPTMDQFTRQGGSVAIRAQKEAQIMRVLAHLPTPDGDEKPRRKVGRPRTRGGTGHSESDGRVEEDEEDEQKPKRKRNKDSTDSLAKKMMDTHHSLKGFEQFEADMASGENVPASLEEMDSSSEDSGDGYKDLGLQVDDYMDSECMRRAKADTELRIHFQTPLYEWVGKLCQVFRLNAASDLAHLAGPLPFKLDRDNFLELLFLAWPGSRLRCALFDRLEMVHPGGFKVSVDFFWPLLAYVFQLKARCLRALLEPFGNAAQAEALDGQLQQFGSALEPFKVANWDGQTEGGCARNEEGRIRQENICALLDVWPKLAFAHWPDGQLQSLLAALSALYLDRSMQSWRFRVALAIKTSLDQLAMDSADRLEQLLFQFGCRGMLESAGGELARLVPLFSLFCQFEPHFQRAHRLATVQAVLHFVIAGEGSNGIQKEEPLPHRPSLAEVLELLPEAVKCLKERDSPNDLYLLYNRLVDELTADTGLLEEESGQSLESAEDSYRSASALLNRKNINDKMIDFWARSLHRIREVRRNRTGEGQGGLEAVPQKLKSSGMDAPTPAKKSPFYYSTGLSSSSEEEDGEGEEEEEKEEG